MAETPPTQEQVNQLAGHLNDICNSIKRFMNYGWDLPHADPHQFIHDNFRVLDKQIQTAIAGVSVLNGFHDDIGDCSCRKWRGKTKFALRQLRKLNQDFAIDCNGVDYEPDRGQRIRSCQRARHVILAEDEDYDLGKGRESFKRNILPIRDSILKYLEDLEATDFAGDSAVSESIRETADDAVKPAPATADVDGAAGMQTVTDKPDGTMYVKSPDDLRVYSPQKNIMSTNTIGIVSTRRLVTIIENPDNKVRWTRPPAKSGTPMGNRRSIHLGDWLRYEDDCRAADPEGFPQLTPADLERRKAAIRQSKQLGK